MRLSLARSPNRELYSYSDRDWWGPWDFFGLEDAAMDHGCPEQKSHGEGMRVVESKVETDD